MIPNDFADRRHLISESRQANQNCHITAQEEVGVREFGISSSVKLFILALCTRYQKMVEWMDNAGPQLISLGNHMSELGAAVAVIQKRNELGRCFPALATCKMPSLRDNTD